MFPPQPAYSREDYQVWLMQFAERRNTFARHCDLDSTPALMVEKEKGLVVDENKPGCPAVSVEWFFYTADNICGGQCYQSSVCSKCLGGTMLVAGAVCPDPSCASVGFSEESVSVTASGSGSDAAVPPLSRYSHPFQSSLLRA